MGRYAPRFAQRRDHNEPELIKFAKLLGWYFKGVAAPRSKTDLPSDWVGLFRGKWHVIEIKNPDKEGHANEFTDGQREFHADVFSRGGRILVWRTKEDVTGDSQARVSA